MVSQEIQVVKKWRFWFCFEMVCGYVATGFFFHEMGFDQAARTRAYVLRLVFMWLLRERFVVVKKEEECLLVIPRAL